MQSSQSNRYEYLKSMVTGLRTAEGAFGAVWCISDLHTDSRPNLDWLVQLPAHKEDAIIVSGDICTSIKKLRIALGILCEKFRFVFYVSDVEARLNVSSNHSSHQLKQTLKVVGNHELWTYKGGPDSIDKFIQAMELCSELGVFTAPTLLGDSLAVVPLQG